MLVTPAPVPPMGNLKLPPSNLREARVVQQRLKLFLAVHHELDVVAGGEAQMAVAVLVGDLADLPNVGDTHQPGAAAADGVDLVPGFGHMDQNAGLQNLVIEPLALVF